MEDHVQDANCSDNSRERNEPVRTRWSPKPDQILILESIFNSGMVNPPKDETVRIRKLLEKFGPVGDANVFYWFQNRRSRSRRRQRQIQASPAGEQHSQTTERGGATEYESGSASGIVPLQNMGPSQSSDCLVGASSPCGNDVNDLFSVSGQMGFPVVIDRNSSTASALSHSDTSSFQNQSGGMMVFINGVPTEVGRGPIDIKGMFGEDVLLVHSSGMPIFFNDYGFSVQTLQHGESYFLVPRPS